MWKSMFLVLFFAVGCTSSGITQNSTSANLSGNIVHITNTGFNPQVLTINTGDTVTWINDGSLPSWPASNTHPTHRDYPGSGIDKCGTSAIFDACGSLRTGEIFSFTFNNAGNWSYHDHLAPSITGTIIVK